MSGPYKTWEYVVGLLLIALVVFIVHLIVTYWYIVLILAATLFLLWFGSWSPWARLSDERESIRELYHEVKRLDVPFTKPLTASFGSVVQVELYDLIGCFTPPGRDIIEYVCEQLSSEVVEDAGEVPPIPVTDDRIVLARYRDQLAALYAKRSAGAPAVNSSAPLTESISRLFLDLPAACLEAAIKHDDESTTAAYHVAIGDLLENPGMTIERMTAPFIRDEVIEAGHFASLYRQLDFNSEAAKIRPGDRNESAAVLADIYFGDTPLRKLFDIQFPFDFPEEQRLEHMVVVAGSGHGKTQTLEALITADLDQTDPPGMVVIDSKGDMVERLARLDVFNPVNGRLRDKIVIIDARDSPHLNPFDVKLSKAADEQAVSRLISGMSYFFQALLGSDLSGTMRVALYPFLHLMLRIEGATMNTLIEAMADPSLYDAEIETMPDAPRNYLKHEYKRVRSETRNAIKDRLYDLRMMSPAFDRMFGAPHNALDLPAALNQGKIVLVNLDRDYLEKEPSAILGKWFIAQTHRAALSRSSIPPRARRAAYLIVDEAGPYFDEQTEDVLRTMRSYRVGAVLAFQDFCQAPLSLQSAIFSSTAIRLAGGSSDLDAKILAGPLRTDPGFILSRRKRDRSFSEFACFVSRLTPRAVSLSVPHGTVDRRERMTEEHYEDMRLRNRAMLTRTDFAATPECEDAPVEPELEESDSETPEPPLQESPPRDEAPPRREAPIIRVGDRDENTRLGKW